MTNHQMDWLFNLSLRLAVIICLSTLAVGLMMGIDPLTALFRSSIAFISFAALGWAASMMWNVPETQEVSVETEVDDNVDGEIKTGD